MLLWLPIYVFSSLADGLVQDTCSDDGRGDCQRPGIFINSMLQSVSLTAERTNLAELQNATGKGAVATVFMQREGLRPVQVGAQFQEAPSVDLMSQLCPPFSRFKFALQDQGQDAGGGYHWIFRILGKNKSTLIHVHNPPDSSGLRFSPRGVCNVGVQLLQEDDERVPDGPIMVSKSNTLVTMSKDAIIEAFLQHLPSCGMEEIPEVDVLAASSEIIDGFEIMISSRLVFRDGAKRYDALKVKWEVHDHRSPLIPHVELPHGLSWCDLRSTSSSSSSLAMIAEREGHEAVDEFHHKLGYLGAYRDVLNQDKLQPVKQASCVDPSSLPETYLLRNHETHSRCFQERSVTSQGSCGSCWAFAASQAASGRACMRDPGRIDTDGTAEGRKQFSAQGVLSCNKDRRGCNGGWMSTAFNEYKKGISFSDEYEYKQPSSAWPWHSLGEHCLWGEYKKPYRVTDVYTLTSGVTGMMQEVFCNGPFTVAFQVHSNFGSFFYYEPTGVYDTTNGTSVSGGHAVTLVGLLSENAQ